MNILLTFVHYYVVFGIVWTLSILIRALIVSTYIAYMHLRYSDDDYYAVIDLIIKTAIGKSVSNTFSKASIERYGICGLKLCSVIWITWPYYIIYMERYLYKVYKVYKTLYEICKK